MVNSKAHKLNTTTYSNWETEVEHKWVYDDFVQDRDYREDWVSVNSIAIDHDKDLVYVGVGTFCSDLLYEFDRKSSKLRSLDYKAVSEPFDAKFHCSLIMDERKELFAAVAQFHDVDKQQEALGGRLIKYSPDSAQYTVLDRPVPGAYIQSIAMDHQRRTLYGFTLSPEIFFKHDLDSQKSEALLNVGNSMELCQPHNPVIDDQGRVWGTYGIFRAFSYDPGIDSIRLFCYDPGTGKTEFFKHGLPRLSGGDKGQVDRAINGRDGFLYFGGVSGSFSRLDPRTGDVQLLGKPCANSRLAGLCLGPDGCIYGAGGDSHYATIFRYDAENMRTTTIGRIYDTDLQEAPVRIHDIAMTKDRVIYAGENDNRMRSSYLWECRLE